MKKFPFPNSLQFAPLDSFFVNQGRLPVINDSAIIFENTIGQMAKKYVVKKIRWTYTQTASTGKNIFLQLENI
jgi:hypothetical protein